MYNIAVVGSRSFTGEDYDTMKKILDGFHKFRLISEGAKEADKAAEFYAEKRNIFSRLEKLWKSSRHDT